LNGPDPLVLSMASDACRQDSLRGATTSAGSTFDENLIHRKVVSFVLH
jgi:hypothetical protein